MLWISDEYMFPLWNNIGSHGIKPMKLYLLVGLIMKEVIVFKKYLGWIVKETVE
jgi:hypothetical protein